MGPYASVRRNVSPAGSALPADTGAPGAHTTNHIATLAAKAPCPSSVFGSVLILEAARVIHFHNAGRGVRQPSIRIVPITRLLVDVRTVERRFLPAVVAVAVLVA
jgi:hypothetical protein